MSGQAMHGNIAIPPQAIATPTSTGTSADEFAAHN